MFHEVQRNICKIGVDRERYERKGFCPVHLVRPIPLVFMDPGHWELATGRARLWTDLISNAELNSSWRWLRSQEKPFQETGFLFCNPRQLIQQRRASAAKPADTPASTCWALCFSWGQKETHQRSEPGAADGKAATGPLLVRASGSQPRSARKAGEAGGDELTLTETGMQ